MIITNPDRIEEILTRRVEAIYPSREALKKVLLSGKRIRLYQGFDPSTPHLHIGHLVGLLKLKEFQDLGHEVIFLIGDFTGMIGDPTGKIEGARPQLSHEQVLKNARGYKQQAGKILNFTGKNPALLKYNGEWLGKLSAIKAFQMMGFLTLPQIIKRDMFQQRMKKGQDLYASELLYPFMQAYDSLAMDVDLEIGGSDQMFNMLVGRDLMKKVKNKEKFVMTTKLLVDSTGTKIGKTEGNVINIDNPPIEFYSQIMSLPDSAIIPCFELITEVPQSKVEEIKREMKNGENPLTFKKLLAFELTKMLNGEIQAEVAKKEFEKVHQEGELPSKIKNFKLKIKNWNIIDLLVHTKLCSSRSQAKRLVVQKAVELNQLPITNYQSLITINPGDIIRVGKHRWLKFV